MTTHLLARCELSLDARRARASSTGPSTARELTVAEARAALRGAAGATLHALMPASPTSCAAGRRATSSPTSSTATSTSPTCASSTAPSARSAATTARRRATSSPMDEVVRRAVEAWELGATEVCIQAGPAAEARRLATTSSSAARSRRRCPSCTCTPSRPEEILYGATRSGHPDPRVPRGAQGRRARHAPRHVGRDPRRRRSATSSRTGRITTAQWIEVITTAHALGHPHHLDDHVRPRRDARALDAPHGSAARHPEGHRRLHRVRAAVVHPPGGADVPQGPRARRAAGRDAASRWSRCTRSRGSCSGPTFRNIQASWVKEGPKLAQMPAHLRAPTTSAAR